MLACIAACAMRHLEKRALPVLDTSALRLASICSRAASLTAVPATQHGHSCSPQQCMDAVPTSQAAACERERSALPRTARYSCEEVCSSRRSWWASSEQCAAQGHECSSTSPSWTGGQNAAARRF
eukprot:4064385-Pleurochrysis_carterae.AAC.1